jgi:hypothetical protein
MVKPRQNLIMRKHIRFEPDLGTIALIDTSSEGKFDPKINGLTLQESQGGAAILVASTIIILEGEIIQVKVGNLHVMKAEVRWLKRFEGDVYKIGIQYLE